MKSFMATALQLPSNWIYHFLLTTGKGNVKLSTSHYIPWQANQTSSLQSSISKSYLMSEWIFFFKKEVIQWKLYARVEKCCKIVKMKRSQHSNHITSCESNELNLRQPLFPEGEKMAIAHLHLLINLDICLFMVVHDLPLKLSLKTVHQALILDNPCLSKSTDKFFSLEGAPPPKKRSAVTLYRL